MLMLLLLFINADLQAEPPAYFTLVAADCKVSGPIAGKEISSYAGTLWAATCTVQGHELLIATMELESRKPIGNESYDYTIMGDVAFAVSKSGAIRYVFDFTEGTFYYGQVNVVLEKGVVLTKTCVGRIEFKK